MPLDAQRRGLDRGEGTNSDGGGAVGSSGIGERGGDAGGGIGVGITVEGGVTCRLVCLSAMRVFRAGHHTPGWNLQGFVNPSGTRTTVWHCVQIR